MSKINNIPLDIKPTRTIETKKAPEHKMPSESEPSNKFKKLRLREIQDNDLGFDDDEDDLLMEIMRFLK